MDRTKIKRVISKAWKRTKQGVKIIRRLFVWGLLLMVIGMFIGGYWLYRQFTYVPELKPDTVLAINLDGMVLDVPSNPPIVQRVLAEDVQTRQGVVNNIRKATYDPRIIGIFLNIKNYGMFDETALEIRDELLKFKQAGKKIFAYIEVAMKRCYLLASPAHKIYMPAPGDVYMRGWRAEIPFYKDMFDKIGMTPEFIYIGKYKTAPQIFTMNHISDEYREIMNDLLDAYSQDYVTQIATVRNIPEEKVQIWIDDALYPATEALKAGMIDELMFEDEVEQHIQVELGLAANLEEAGEKELNTINNAQYARIDVDAPWLHKTGEKIAVVYAQGSITSGKAPSSPYNGIITAENMSKLLAKLGEDEEIKGIILRVDSGGGGARASTLIWNAVRKAQEKKPVVVSMVGAAASGGYMISAPASSIVAYPLTITGSIGIFGGKFSMEGLHEFIGLNVEIIQRGKNASLFTSARSWTESERERYRFLIQDGYEDFIQKVAEGRGMSAAEVDKIAQGRVWTGEQALEIGLVDHLGGMEKAIAVVKDEVGIAAEEDVQLVEYPRIENPFDFFLQRLRETHIDAKLPKEVRQLQQQFEELSALENEHLFAWFPVPKIIE